MAMLARAFDDAVTHLETARDASRVGNPRVLLSLLGPAVRGFILQRAKRSNLTPVETANTARFDWRYERDRPQMAALTAHARRSQWDPAGALDWSTPVDPHDPERELWPEELTPLCDIPQYRTLDARTRADHRQAFLSWVLSQFLHGEQGALFAACQVTEAVQWMDGKLFGSMQVAEEGKHVEVFHRYLTEKLGKLYQINDNLYVIIDALMTDGRWDMKFLGMQIMIEGLALGGFGTIRAATREPLLARLLEYVISDDAGHVHFGVLALAEHYANLSDRERRDREDWAFELSLLLRNRFLAHEFYDEYYGHLMSRREWNARMLGCGIMQRFRRSMFRRIVPNLKRIHLLSDRIRPHYRAIGLLDFEHDKAAPELTLAEVLSSGEV